ncbi:Protein ssh4 [Microsporum canis]|uniref:Protein SSH4 n=1 Tax=Arthroderma otae (strain ATCC MYA-4605 / CBS 113480) TaxID=554155 RepID=C5FUV2_ARTOC|nr:endosome protein [Microsporum canis CBS 113480]EEQ33686.1 endosome protein [Microsporum canis CBS 113480]
MRPSLPSSFVTSSRLKTKSKAASTTTSTTTTTTTPTTTATLNRLPHYRFFFNNVRPQLTDDQLVMMRRQHPVRMPFEAGDGPVGIPEGPGIGGGGGSDGTGKGILIGLLSAFGSAGIAILVLAIFFFFRYTQRGRILLDRFGRPGEYDDEQEFAREEAEALESMDELQAAEYFRAKAFVQANPPETMQTDISLSQFLAIQEKGVSAWEFEPELEIANCFVEGRTEIEFFDSECGVQSNLPVPKQNDVYYWEAKIYDKPETTLISIGMTTKPYPLFRLPGFHKSSVAYQSTGHRRHNQPFKPTPYAPAYVQGDVVGVGYRPRSGTIFFTRNGKKLDDVVHGLRSQNFFPTVGANGPATVHVNFGQMGFVFIEANVKKWGLAPTTGSLAPPPPYGSEQGSILLEAGGESSSGAAAAAAAATGQDPSQAQVQAAAQRAAQQWWHPEYIQHHAQHAHQVQQHQRQQSQIHARARSGTLRGHLHASSGQAPTAPVRTPTDISLGPLPHVASASTPDVPAGSETSENIHSNTHSTSSNVAVVNPRPPIDDVPPPEYRSPGHSPPCGQSDASEAPPIPSYDAAVRESRERDRLQD